MHAIIDVWKTIQAESVFEFRSWQQVNMLFIRCQKNCWWLWNNSIWNTLGEYEIIFKIISIVSDNGINCYNSQMKRRSTGNETCRKKIKNGILFFTYVLRKIPWSLHTSNYFEQVKDYHWPSKSVGVDNWKSNGYNLLIWF